jgi:tetratricopeptide (TPR) repeat protein
MDKLPKEISQIVDDLCRKGDHFAGMEQYDDALEKYGQAWDLLPEPRNQWPAATWILMSAGDAHFRMKEFDEGADLLWDAIEFPEGDSNPFLHLRLGQCLLELGQMNEAANVLEEAFRTGGEELFADEDPKYLGFVKTQLKIGPATPPTAPRGRFNHPLS